MGKRKASQPGPPPMTLEAFAAEERRLVNHHRGLCDGKLRTHTHLDGQGFFGTMYECTDCGGHLLVTQPRYRTGDAPNKHYSVAADGGVFTGLEAHDDGGSND